MGRRCLIDSNVIIDFCAGRLPEPARKLLVGLEPEISIITQIELFATNNIPALEYSLLQEFTAITAIHPLTVDLVETTISIRKDYRLKLPDAIIAATAVVANLPLLTRNVSDFRKVITLEVIDPYSLI